jgi:hypothetical protein
MDSALPADMQPNSDPNARGDTPRPSTPSEPQPIVIEKSDDPAVVITRTGSSYNARVITAAVVALALLVVVWVVVRQRRAPGSDLASGGEVVVDSSPIPQRDAPPGGTGTATPYWPAIPYSNGQPSGQVITPSPYTAEPLPYATQPPAYPTYPAYPTQPAMPPEPEPVRPTAPVVTQTPTHPSNAGTPAATPTQTVFPRLDSILGIPTDSQGRARVPHKDTVTHIDSVLRRSTMPAKPVVPTHVDTTTTTSSPTIPLGTTTRADTISRGRST